MTNETANPENLKRAMDVIYPKLPEFKLPPFDRPQKAPQGNPREEAYSLTTLALLAASVRESSETRGICTRILFDDEHGRSVLKHVDRILAALFPHEEPK